jgi:hypothetical protein
VAQCGTTPDVASPYIISKSKGQALNTEEVYSLRVRYMVLVCTLQYILSDKSIDAANQNSDGGPSTKRVEAEVFDESKDNYCFRFW